MVDRRTVLRNLAAAGLLSSTAGSGIATGTSATLTDATAAPARSTDPPSVAWRSTNGARRTSEAIDAIAPTDDGGFACAGYRSERAGGRDAVVWKLEGAGEVAWSTAIDQGRIDAATDVVEDDDGGLAVAGWTRSQRDSTPSARLHRLDATGDLEWSRTVEPATANGGVANALVASPAGYTVVGGTNPTGDGSGLFARFDAHGDPVRRAVHAGDGTSEINDVTIAAGEYLTYVGSVATNEGADVLLGQEIDDPFEWTGTYGGPGAQVGRAVTGTADGGVAIAATTAPPTQSEPRVWVLKFDDAGDLEWEVTYGGPGTDVAASIDELPDGGYTLAGWTDSDVDDEQSWLLELDENGQRVRNERFGGDGVDRFTDHVRTVPRGHVAGGLIRDDDAGQAAHAMGIGEGERAVTPARGLDDTSFLSVFPGEVTEAIGAERFARDSIDDLHEAEIDGAATPDAVSEGLERLAIGQEASLELMEFASPAGGEDELHYPRRIAEYLVSVVTDLIMQQLALGEKLTDAVPDRLTRSIDAVGDYIGGAAGSDSLSVSFFDDIIDYVLDLALDSDDVRSETLWRISSTAEDVFGDLWDQASDAITDSAAWMLDMVEGAIDTLKSTIARIIQAGYETGTLDAFTTAVKVKSGAGSLPAAAADAIELQHLLANVGGTWRALWDLHTEIPETVADGRSLAGTTAAARTAKEETVADIREDMENSGGWLELIADDLVSFGIVENFLETLGAIKDLVEADSLWGVGKALFSGAIDLVQGVLGVLTKYVEAIVSLGAAFVAGDVLAYTGRANVAIVDSVIDGTDEVELFTPYDYVPPVDETIPAYEEFQDAL